ncbi:MAG: hypothetical protein WC449_02280 [Candidatus Paceibacterota bacterium]
MSKKNRKEKGKHEAFQKYPNGQHKKVEKPKKKSRDKREKSEANRA